MSLSIWRFCNKVSQPFLSFSPRLPGLRAYAPSSSLLVLSLSLRRKMAGVWEFKDGVIRRMEKPVTVGRRTILVYAPTGEEITSNEKLEEKLVGLGWERYPLNDPDFIQFHVRSSPVLLISVPRDFSRIRSMHMYDIALKTRNVFLVRDGWIQSGSAFSSLSTFLSALCCYLFLSCYYGVYPCPLPRSVILL